MTDTMLSKLYKERKNVEEAILYENKKLDWRSQIRTNECLEDSFFRHIVFGIASVVIVALGMLVFYFLAASDTDQSLFLEYLFLYINPSASSEKALIFGVFSTFWILIYATFKNVVFYITRVIFDNDIWFYKIFNYLVGAVIYIGSSVIGCVLIHNFMMRSYGRNYLTANSLENILDFKNLTLDYILLFLAFSAIFTVINIVGLLFSVTELTVVIKASKNVVGNLEKHNTTLDDVNERISKCIAEGKDIYNQAIVGDSVDEELMRKAALEFGNINACEYFIEKEYDAEENINIDTIIKNNSNVIEILCEQDVPSGLLLRNYHEYYSSSKYKDLKEWTNYGIDAVNKLRNIIYINQSLLDKIDVNNDKIYKKAFDVLKGSVQRLIDEKEDVMRGMEALLDTMPNDFMHNNSYTNNYGSSYNDDYGMYMSQKSYQDKVRRDPNYHPDSASVTDYDYLNYSSVDSESYASIDQSIIDAG